MKGIGRRAAACAWILAAACALGMSVRAQAAEQAQAAQMQAIEQTEAAQMQAAEQTQAIEQTEAAQMQATEQTEAAQVADQMQATEQTEAAQMQATEQTEAAQVADQAQLLTEEERAQVAQQVDALEQETGWDVMAVTTVDAGGMGAEEYAEAWFDKNTGSDDGVICAIDMDNREIVIRAFGECRFYITDDRTEEILDAGYESVSDGRYADALKAMLAEAGEAYREETPQDNFLYDEDTGETVGYEEEHRKVTPLEAAVAFAVALAAGGAAAGGVVGAYRMKLGGYQYPIGKNGSVSLSRKEDRFMDRFVARRHIQRESSGGSGGSGGGRSAVHTGAGGRSSSGGSRKF